MITAQILDAANRLAIRTEKRLSSIRAGNNRTAYRGSGMQFKEFRPYEPGDDIRHMSWSVTARTGRPTIKLFESDRELDVLVFVDTSGSSLTDDQRKLEMYAECLATVGISAIQAGDNFGVVLFNEAVSRFIPPRRHSHQVRVALTHLLAESFRGHSADMNHAIEFAHRALRHRSLILILSDFWVPSFGESLRVASTRHEFILIQAGAQDPKQILRGGLFEFTDPETGEIHVLESDGASLRRMEQSQHELDSNLKEITEKTRCGLLTLSTEDDYVYRLVHFINRRGPARF